jgi:hypothetical protein
MTISVKKKVTLKDHVIEEQQEKELSWLNSLRHLLPPKENENEEPIWQQLSPAACKIYRNYSAPCFIINAGHVP